MTARKIAIASVVWDPAVMPRVERDDATVAEYREVSRTDDLPPIDVFFDGKAYYGADGSHRCEALRLNGETEIMAHTHRGSKADAVWFAAGANQRHGLRPKSADKEKAVRNCLAFPDILAARSDSQIAGQCGTNPMFVARIRKLAEKDQGAMGDDSTAADGSSVPVTVKARKPRKVQVNKTTGEKPYVMDVTNIGGKSAGRPSKARSAALKKKQQKDGLGNQIPEFAKQVAIDSADFDTFLTKVGKVVDAATKLHGLASGAGAEIDLKWLADQVQEIRNHVQTSRFWAACPECSQHGKILKQCRCGGRGWMTRAQYERLRLEAK